MQQPDSVQKEVLVHNGTYFFLSVRELRKVAGNNDEQSSCILLHSIFEPVNRQVFHFSNNTFPQKR